MSTETNEPCIILIMQNIRGVDNIAWLDDLCVTKDDGDVMVFPNVTAADHYREDNSIDGKIVTLPIY